MLVAMHRVGGYLSYDGWAPDRDFRLSYYMVCSRSETDFWARRGSDSSRTRVREESDPMQIGCSSEYSMENIEGRSGEGFRVNSLT